MVVYVNFCKDIFMFEAAMASGVLLHNSVYVLHRRRSAKTFYFITASMYLGLHRKVA